MTNKFERQLYGDDVKSISYDRLMALTLVVSTILALVFIHVPVGMLYFYVDWTKWEKFGAIIGWSVGFLGYLWLATHASSYEALGAAARFVIPIYRKGAWRWLTWPIEKLLCSSGGVPGTVLRNKQGTL